jgi:hypothetical protein
MAQINLPFEGEVTADNKDGFAIRNKGVKGQEFLVKVINGLEYTEFQRRTILLSGVNPKEREVTVSGVRPRMIRVRQEFMV